MAAANNPSRLMMQHLKPRISNGGGSGSVETSAGDAALTEDIGGFPAPRTVYDSFLSGTWFGPIRPMVKKPIEDVPVYLPFDDPQDR